MIDCPGEGRCHGCAVWCDTCGDVKAVCDSPTCQRHHCERCSASLNREDLDGSIGYTTWCAACCASDHVERWEARMLACAERGDEEGVATCRLSIDRINIDMAGRL